MFRKEGSGKIHKVIDRVISRVCPPRGKFEAVARTFAFRYSFAVSLPDMVVPGGIAVIFRVCSVFDLNKAAKRSNRNA